MNRRLTLTVTFEVPADNSTQICNDETENIIDLLEDKYGAVMVESTDAPAVTNIPEKLDDQLQRAFTNWNFALTKYEYEHGAILDITDEEKFKAAWRSLDLILIY